MNRNSSVFHDFYKLQLDALIETISSWPGFERFVGKLQHLRKNIVEKGCQMFDPHPNHLNTLNHGDFWLNNVLIKYKNNENSNNEETHFENVIFIDFQDSYWTYPAIDLQYFLNTSLCESLRPDSFDELIEFYHEQLSRALNRLNYRKHIPTGSEFLEQFNARNFYGKLTERVKNELKFHKDDDSQKNHIHSILKYRMS